jgi:hypothetical protein
MMPLKILAVLRGFLRTFTRVFVDPKLRVHGIKNLHVA